MRSGLAVALGLALSALLAAAAVAAQLRSLRPPPAAEGAVQAEYGVGGVIHVYVNGELRYRGPMNSFTDNPARILYALLAGLHSVTVTDMNGTVRTIQVDWRPWPPGDWSPWENFYLPLSRCGADLTYHGYPGAKLWVRSSTLNQNVTTDIRITPVIIEQPYYDQYGSLICRTSAVPRPIMYNSTHEWFWVNITFTASASSSGPLTLTYARLMHDEGANPIYVPMMVDTIPLSVSAGDTVEVRYQVFVASPPSGGGTRLLTYFVYEMLNPDMTQDVVWDDIYILISAPVGTPPDFHPDVLPLHDLRYTPTFFMVAGQSPEREVSWFKVTSASWEFRRSTIRYDYPFLNESLTMQLSPVENVAQVELHGKTVTVRGLLGDVGGRTITGIALFQDYDRVLLVIREDVRVPEGAVLQVEITVTFW